MLMRCRLDHIQSSSLLDQLHLNSLSNEDLVCTTKEPCFCSLKMVKFIFVLLLLAMGIVTVHSLDIPDSHSDQTISLTSSVLRQSFIPNHVYLAADDSAKLYVNGVNRLSTTNWREFGYATLNIRNGDVISIIANDPGGVEWGVIAELYVNGRYYATGRDDWLARRAFTTSTSWMLRSYPQSEACRWRRAAIRPAPSVWGNGKAPYFKLSTAASYVWAADAGERDSIFLRLVVGGQPCRIFSRIIFAADDQSELYVNGVFRGATSTWPELKIVTLSLEKGDVVALKVKDSGGVRWGAVAAVQTQGISTTGKDDWRAVKAFNIAGDKRAWMYPSYDACRWPLAKLRPGAGIVSEGKSPDFPYRSTGADYVWASNAGEFDEIFLRTVIGVQC